MAFTWSVNNRPSTGSVAMYQILQNFIVAGWTVQSSSDGTTYDSTGNIITSGGTGAGGFGNNYAWVRIQDPGGVREFTIQRETANYYWTFAYSPAAHFTGGSPGPTVTPTATDGVNPFTGNIFTTDNSYSIHMMMGDSSISYGFWIYGITNGGGAAFAWLMDPIQGADTGDLDPTVHYFAEVSNTIGGHLVNNQNAKAFFTSITSSNFVSCGLGAWYYGVNGNTGNIGANSWNGLEDVWPVFYYSSSKGWKGWSTLIRMYASGSHNVGDVLSVGNPPGFGSKNALVVYGLVLPWLPGVDCAL